MKRCAILLAWVASCGGGAAPSPSTEQVASHHLDSLTFPLFPEGLGQEYLDLRAARREAGKPRTSLTDGIPWAASLDEAFERATREDKPVLVATLVRENGDPDCDV